MTSDTKKINERNIDISPDFSGLIKHIVRCNLWLPAAKSLKDEKNGFLKYFTLPGRWAWDIFFFEKNGLIKKNGRCFPDVRFCEKIPKVYTDTKKLLGSTIGKMGEFEKLVLRDEKEFWDGFPYDLYNLDFTGTLFPDEQPPFSDTFESINKIIEKHVASNFFPFVIFLTMKALKIQTKEEAIDKLKENIETNRANNEFTEQINNLIPNTENFVNSSFVDFILISIPKIICYLAKDQCNVEIITRAKYYRRNPTTRAEYFIVTFIFKFKNKRRRDLSIRNENYNKNVLNIFRLDNVQTIDNRPMNKREIENSLDEITKYISSFSVGGG